MAEGTSTRGVAAGHGPADPTAHYSVAQVLEIREALELITDEKHANNGSLASIIRESRVPAKAPAEMKRPEAMVAPGLDLLRRNSGASLALDFT
jgi:hypothetical protein